MTLRLDCIGGGSPTPPTGQRKDLVMERRRCQLCRNPIRTAGVRWTAGADPLWFHADCSRAAQQQRQADYRDEVRRGGLDALLAPYSRTAGSPAWDAAKGLQAVGA